MKRTPAKEYLDQAALLTRDEAERLFARMPGKIERRMRNRKIDPLEAAAIQLELEDEQLQEWRQRWAEVVGRRQAR